jgi:acetyltransferase-like isoleucine patch superfamily enzyme
MNIGKLYLFTYLWTSTAFAAGLIELANSQIFINEQFIHQSVQDDMKDGNLSQDTLKLIKNNKILSDAVELAQDPKNQSSLCADIDKSTDPDPPKKKVTKKNHGWVIISSTEVSQARREPQYQELVPSLPQESYNDFYSQLRSAESATDLQNLVKAQTQDMSEDEYFSYLSEMTERLPYNSDKADFDQSEQGVDDFFSQITEDREALAGTSDKTEWGGICGDIHFATVLMGEAARPGKYEYFTASYVIGDGQHVHAFAVSKEDPNKAFVVNYNEVTKVDNITGVDSLLPRNNSIGDFANVGANVRIFKNTSDSTSGKAEHVATLPSALGRYIEQAHTRDHQRANLPQLNAGITNQIDFRNESTITKTKGDKTKTIEIAQGVRLLQGTLQNEDQSPTDVFSIAVYKERTKNTDGFGNILNSKKLGNESNLSLSSSLVSSSQSIDENKYMFMRLNYYKGIHKNLISSEKVKIQANVGSNLNVDVVTKDGQTSGDANIQTNVGISGRVKTSTNSSVTSMVKATGAIGLKEERSVYQLSSLPNNLKMTTNVIEARARFDQRVDNDTFSVGAGLVSTQVGGVYNVFSSYQISTVKSGTDHFINIDYSKPTQGFNRDISANLIPVNEQTSLMYGIKTGAIEAGGTLTYDIQNTNFYVGGKLKINILPGKKRSPGSN